MDVVERFCPSCGTRGVSAFCPNDGTEMKLVQAGAAALHPLRPGKIQPALSQGVSRLEGGRKRKRSAIAISAVLVAAVMVGAAVYLIRAQQAPGAPPVDACPDQWDPGVQASGPCNFISSENGQLEVAFGTNTCNPQFDEFWVPGEASKVVLDLQFVSDSTFAGDDESILLNWGEGYDWQIFPSGEGATYKTGIGQVVFVQAWVDGALGGRSWRLSYHVDCDLYFQYYNGQDFHYVVYWSARVGHCTDSSNSPNQC